MTPLIIFGAALTVVFLALLVLRVSSVFFMMSIAVGALLQVTLTESTALALAAIIKDGPVELIARIGLLVLPVVLTVFLLRKSMKKREVLVQIFPLLLACFALGSLVVASLDIGVQDQIHTGPIGSVVGQSADLGIALAGILNLAIAWRAYRFKDEHGHGKHHG